MKKVLITGAAGFVGAHMVEAILKSTDWKIVALDRFDTSGNPNRLADMLLSTPVDMNRVEILFWDLKSELNDQIVKQLGGPFDYIIHLAAGSHVDRSIDNPMLFFMDNCIGTVNLLNYAKSGGLNTIPTSVDDSDNFKNKIDGKFLYFSTDEVYGPYPMDAEGGFKEWDRLNPNNPYAAAKAAAEMAVIAYANTYSIPCVITNQMNIFGERQHPEKFIPLVINKLLKGGKLYIHSNKDKTQAGKRHYLHARNVSSAALWVLEHGKILDGSAKEGRYNVVGDVELDNLALAEMITKFVNEWRLEKDNEAKELKLDYELVDFHSSRPGHDLRYALDGRKLKEEGFSYPVDFENSLKKTVYWMLNHPTWL